MVDAGNGGLSDAGDGGVPDAGDGGLTDAGIRCIQGWPSAAPSIAIPSLASVTPALLWRKKLPWLGFETDVVLADNRLALVSGVKLWVFDLAGNIKGEVLEGTSQLGTGVVADPLGNSYFATSKVLSVAPDGGIRWEFPFGVNLALTQETTSASKFPILGPDNILYSAATDGFLYALDANDGGIVWKRQVGLALLRRM